MNDKKLGVAGIVSIVFSALNALGLLASMGYSLHIRHEFVEIYDDLGANLPGLTRMFINIHWTVWVLTSLILLAMLAAKELIAVKWIPLLLNGIFVLIGIAYWAIYSTALMLPFMTVIRHMENG